MWTTLLAMLAPTPATLFAYVPMIMNVVGHALRGALAAVTYGPRMLGHLFIPMRGPLHLLAVAVTAVSLAGFGVKQYVHIANTNTIEWARQSAALDALEVCKDVALNANLANDPTMREWCDEARAVRDSTPAWRTFVRVVETWPSVFDWANTTAATTESILLRLALVSIAVIVLIAAYQASLPVRAALQERRTRAYRDKHARAEEELCAGQLTDGM